MGCGLWVVLWADLDVSATRGQCVVGGGDCQFLAVATAMYFARGIDWYGSFPGKGPGIAGAGRIGGFNVRVVVDSGARGTCGVERFPAERGLGPAGEGACLYVFSAELSGLLQGVAGR